MPLPYATREYSCTTCDSVFRLSWDIRLAITYIREFFRSYGVSPFRLVATRSSGF